MRRGWLLFGLLLIAYLATGLYQVPLGGQAVVRRFGRMQDEPRGPGLHLKLPWGMDRVDQLEVDRQRELTIGFPLGEFEEGELPPPGQVLTGDNNLIDLRMVVHYRVGRSADQVRAFALNEQRVDGVLVRAGESALAAALAGENVDAVRLGLARTLEPRIQDRLTSILEPYRLGIRIDSVNLTYTQPPAQLTDIFREVTRAHEQAETVKRQARTERDARVQAALNEDRSVRRQADDFYSQQLRVAKEEGQSFLKLAHRLRDPGTDTQNALLTYYLAEMQIVLSRLQVRTLSDTQVEQTILFPLPEK